MLFKWAIAPELRGERSEFVYWRITMQMDSLCSTLSSAIVSMSSTWKWRFERVLSFQEFWQVYIVWSLWKRKTFKKSNWYFTWNGKCFRCASVNEAYEISQTGRETEIWRGLHWNVTVNSVKKIKIIIYAEAFLLLLERTQVFYFFYFW